MDVHPLNDDAAATPRPQLVRPWIWALLAAVLTLATYLPALAGEFVWDDTQLIEQNPTSRSDRKLVEHFTKPFWEPNSLAPQMSLYYRPLVALSYELDHRIHGLNSAGYRITNYAFHITNVILLFALLRRLGAPGMTAGLLSATWGVLPRLAECVAWISGRTDVLATSALLAALLLWGKRWRNLVLASVSLFFGLLCKETALAGLVVLAYLEFTDGQWKTRRYPLRFMLLASPAVIWLVLKLNVSGLLPRGAEYQPIRVRILTCLEAMGRYPTMVFDWLRPSAESGVMGHPNLTFALVGMGALILMIGLLIRYWPRANAMNKALLLGAATALVPVLHVVQLTVSVNAADRFLYIPLALLTVLVSTSAKLRKSRVLLATVLLVLLSSIPVTVARAKSWADPVELWTSEFLESHGTCQTCRIELAKLQAEAGDFQPALRTQQSLMRDTARQGGVPALVAMNTSILFLRLGDYNRAERLLNNLVSAQPSVPRFWRELATVQAARGAYGDAETSAQRALNLMPAYDNASKAIELIHHLGLKAARLSDPQLRDAQRAQFLSEAGRAHEAEPLWLKILDSNPTPTESEAALSFILNAGSSDAVSALLRANPQILQSEPELATKLRLKDMLHRQLARVNSATKKL